MTHRDVYLFCRWFDPVLAVTLVSYALLWGLLLWVRHLRNPLPKYGDRQAWWLKEWENWGVLAYVFGFSDWLIDAAGTFALVYVVARNVVI